MCQRVRVFTCACVHVRVRVLYHRHSSPIRHRSLLIGHRPPIALTQTGRQQVHRRVALCVSALRKEIRSLADI